MRSRLSIIVAVDEKRGIGKNNDLLVKIPEDLKRFRKITTGHPVIMGRKTFESIGRVLPNRTNIIITRDSGYVSRHPELDSGSNVKVVDSLEKAIEIARKEEMLKPVQHDNEKEIFVIGGGQIFEQVLPLADRIYLTFVKGDFEADVFFPDYSEFKKIVSQEEGESEGLTYTYFTLEQ